MLTVHRAIGIADVELPCDPIGVHVEEGGDPVIGDFDTITDS